MPSETPTPGQWRARPVFISSTFRDMQAERDYLRALVFPRLEEKLRERRHQFEPIDLRMGVETAELGTVEAREALVLKVCLEEIQRSRPFLLVILGDRYGWVPPPERMEAAVQKAGFKTEVKGKSVTALEIEFGVLKEHPEQRRRSFFYFRDPLPYDQMPPATAARYSDEKADDPKVRAGHDKLKALKRDLRTDSELGIHVHDYSAGWDRDAQRVTGLKAWGELVFDHLWAALDEETRDFASKPLVTWEQREQSALWEFVAQRRRDFTGREELLAQLIDIARRPVVCGSWRGACLSGPAGSGKSAVLAELHQRLTTETGLPILVDFPAPTHMYSGSEMLRNAYTRRALVPRTDLLVLMNAAGATPHGADSDAMRRRFTKELATALGIEDEIVPMRRCSDGVDMSFLFLLDWVAATRRVVVLLDAVDQFAATSSEQHFAWLLASSWPANAGLIVSYITGAGPTEEFSRWPGMQPLEIPALTVDNVNEIGKRIYARYHRDVNTGALQLLAGKHLHDGEPASGNPLWLTLALDQLNLLDADDFARADSDFMGSSAERIRALLVETAQRIPPDVAGLYAWLLDQTEKSFGSPHARAFAILIALGRLGWRETDLMVLVPCVGRILFPDEPVAELDDLSLASIRRGFRAHLTRRGASGQLDFFHSQARQAVQTRALGDTKQVQAFHSAIADHLETLPESDPLRETELIFHLIEGNDPARTARVLANLTVSSTTANNAAQALARHINLGRGHQTNAHLAWVTALPAQGGLTADQAAKIAKFFFHDLAETLASNGDLGTRRSLVEASQQSFRRLVARDPGNTQWRTDLSISLSVLGNLAVAQGDLNGASHCFNESKSLAESLVVDDPDNTQLQTGLLLSNMMLGDLAVARGQDATEPFAEANGIARRIAASDINKMEWQRLLQMVLSKQGEVTLAQGDSDEARRLFTESKAIAERLTDSDPTNADWLRELCVSISKLGEIAEVTSDLPAALLHFGEAEEIAERLAENDPGNSQWQRDGYSGNRVGFSSRFGGVF